MRTSIVSNGREWHLERTLHAVQSHLLAEARQLLLQGVQASIGVLGVQQSNKASCTHSSLRVA